MKTIFNRTWIGNYINTEEVTLRQLDGYNKTRYSRRKNKEGLLELASREAHEKQKVYFATILNDDDSPYCTFSLNALRKPHSAKPHQRTSKTCPLGYRRAVSNTCTYLCTYA